MSYLLDRVALERQEGERLAVYAALSGASRGRRYAEAEHGYRTAFQRDRDRIVHSAAFRRLEAKTQVFMGEMSDYYRTRLTHTIEVSQVARTLARALALNEDLAESAALAANDLGHSPYGHCGESVLNEMMAGHGGFEHNAHSLRVVEYLEHPYPSFRGLNLSYETRLCLAKHESRYDHPEARAEYPERFGPLEGQIADLADAIAYNSHDLDDALGSGLIVETDLEGVALYERVRERIGARFPGAHRYARQLRCAKELIEILVGDVFAETVGRLERYRPGSMAAVCAGEVKMVSLSEPMAEQLGQLEAFLLEKVYLHPEVVAAQAEAREELRYLFAYYLARPERLPGRFAERLAQQGGHRVVCDYLAGMTDRYCRRVYLDCVKGGK